MSASRPREATSRSLIHTLEEYCNVNRRLEDGTYPNAYNPPPQRYCHAMPIRSKLLPVRAETPLLA